MSRGSIAVLSRRLLAAFVCVCVLPSHAPAQFTVETKHNDVGLAPARPAGAPFQAKDKPVGAEDVDVDPFLLGTIRHRSMKVRDVESEAYYKVLEHSRKVKYALQKKVAADNVQRHAAHFREQPANARIKFSLFADVFTHPEEYTGELLTVTGYVRQNVEHPRDPEDPLPTYEAWLFSPDAQHNPIVVVYTELPKGMPLGGSLVETVEVTGYFFKVYGYRAQDGLRAAPLLLAKTLEWIPRPVRDTTFERVIYFLVTGTLVVGVIFAFWFVNRRHHLRMQKAAAEPPDFDPRDLQSLTLDAGPSVKVADEGKASLGGTP